MPIPIYCWRLIEMLSSDSRSKLAVIYKAILFVYIVLADIDHGSMGETCLLVHFKIEQIRAS